MYTAVCKFHMKWILIGQVVLSWRMSIILCHSHIAKITQQNSLTVEMDTIHVGGRHKVKLDSKGMLGHRNTEEGYIMFPHTSNFHSEMDMGSGQHQVKQDEELLKESQNRDTLKLDSELVSIETLKYKTKLDLPVKLNTEKGQHKLKLSLQLLKESTSKDSTNKDSSHSAHCEMGIFEKHLEQCLQLSVFYKLRGKVKLEGKTIFMRVLLAYHCRQYEIMLQCVHDSMVSCRTRETTSTVQNYLAQPWAIQANYLCNVNQHNNTADTMQTAPETL